MNSDVPQVGIVMGSDSDWPKIRAVGAALREFRVPFEVRVMSAHRTPELVADYATQAATRGLKVIIAAAGGAAHLGGVIAAHTPLPVIGLPVPTAELGGLDSLLSIVQMPGDVPVACVAVGMGGPRNAGLFAVQILATADPELRERFVDFKRSLVDKILQKNDQLQTRIFQED
jgi:5-(carboxyamino)imidazole ribonucleotide mutase